MKKTRDCKFTVRVSDLEMAEAALAADLLDVTVSQFVRGSLRDLVRKARANGGYWEGVFYSADRLDVMWDVMLSEGYLLTR